MDEGKPSSTALIVAMSRAVHLHCDDDPKVFADPLAMQLCGYETVDALRAGFEALQESLVRRSPEFGALYVRDGLARVLMRQRYAEDELAEAVKRGLGQYVILGAGLDSFAYRRTDLARDLHVFEVDHPATQQWKRSRLKALNLPAPANLTFVPVDFERQTLEQGLSGCGYRVDQPAFFSWLGVIAYLTDQAIFDTLRFIASGVPGTEIVFDYYVVDDLLDEQGRKMMAVGKAQVAALNEPVGAFFAPGDIFVRVKQVGFSKVTDFTPEEANARYFNDRSDGRKLHIPGVTHMLKARV